MATMEFAAGSVEEARDRAAKEFGVARERVVITVLEETKGLFGRGQVRVRAETREEAAVAAEPVAEAEPKKRGGRGRKVAEPRAVVSAPEPEPPVQEEEEDDEEEVEAAAEAEEEVEDDDEPDDAVATTEDAERLLGYLEEILQLADMRVKARVSSLNGKYVHVEVKGRDAGFVVGRKGEVLNALQYLMNVVSARQLGTGVRVVLDADDFRSRRSDVLQKLALDIAEQVRERKEEAVLDALPAFERRVIHQALSEFEGVTTYSEGEEPNRRVVIAPAE